MVQIIKVKIVLCQIYNAQIIVMEMVFVIIKLEFVLVQLDGLELIAINKLFKVVNLSLNCWKFIF